MRGLFGYFPTYTLGNLYAAQLFAKAQSELGGLDEAFARGDFTPLLDWLRAKVHRQGQRYRPATLIEHVTGSKPSHRPLIDSLRQKYAELYGIPRAEVRFVVRPRLLAAPSRSWT